MNHRILFLCSVGFYCVSGLIPSYGQAQPADAPLMEFSMEMQCIVLPTKAATAVIRDLRSQEKERNQRGFSELDKLLDLGTAKLVAWPILHGEQGQSVSHEEVEDVRFATQWDAGSTTAYLRDENGKFVPQPKGIVAEESQPFASSFETRQVGVTLGVEAEPSPDRPGGIRLSYDAKHTRLVSVDRLTTEHEYFKDKRFEKVTQEQPRFSTMSTRASIIIKSGERKLIGSFLLPNAPDQMELFVLGAEIVKKNQ